MHCAPRRLLLSIAAVLLLTACREEPPAPEEPELVQVVTLAPEPVVLTRELPGRARAFVVAEVRPQVSGIVKRVLFDEGGLVEAGQPLYQLDDATYRASVNSAQAQLARARTLLEAARLTSTRADELARIGAISTQDHENATSTLHQAQADVGIAQAALDSAKVTLSYARITAPIAGRIGRSSVTQGALVTANQTEPLATVQQFDPMYIDLNHSASELLQLRKELAAGVLEGASHLPLKVLLEDGSTYEHEARLAFSEVSVNPGTGSYAFRVVVDNPDHLLLPGMYVRAIGSKGVRHDAILVPQRGIQRNPKGDTSAMVVTAESKVEIRPVQVSETVGDRWLVESGLAAGDRVIVAGLQKVDAGDAVRVASSQTAAAAAAKGAVNAAATLR